MEAARSIGVTRGQLLRKIQLPMARRTIVVGINQCTMAALSMATIAAYVDGPGLGQPVTEALQSLDVGSASVSGLAIVIMAIMLDRITTAASERSEVQRRKGKVRGRRGNYILGVLGLAALVTVYLSRQFFGLAAFPESPDLGTPLSKFFDNLTTWVVGTFRRNHERHQGRSHLRAVEPAAVPARGVALVADRDRDRCDRVRDSVDGGQRSPRPRASR